MARPVVLIAGGSRGIGAATARLAGQRGYDVAINYRSNAEAAAALVAAVQASGARAIAVQGDVAREDEIEHMFDTATAALGPVTHFVHSAGIVGKNSRLDAASAETIRDVLDVNLFGALLSARAAVRRISTVHGGQGGSIVLLSSMAAVVGAANEYVWYADGWRGCCRPCRWAGRGSPMRSRRRSCSCCRTRPPTSPAAC